MISWRFNSPLALNLTKCTCRGCSGGTEELNHLEMIGAIVYQLTRNLSEKDIKTAGFDSYFVDHTTGIYPVSAAGVPFDAFSVASKGDPITDLHESLAAEQKAIYALHRKHAQSFYKFQWMLMIRQVLHPPTSIWSINVLTVKLSNS